MKTLFYPFLIFICILNSFTIFAQDTAHVSRIKIHASIEQLQKVLEAGIDFDHGYYDNETSTYINETEYANIKKIKSLGLKVEILVHDVFKYTDSLNRVEDPYKYDKVFNDMDNARTNFMAKGQSYESSISTRDTFFTFGSMGGFYNLAELEAQIDSMVAMYPTLVSKSSIGNTLQGRPIWVVKISDNVGTDEAEPEILYTGMHHSREGMSMMNLIYYMRYLLKNYNHNPLVNEIVDNRELFFIPVVNVDGFNYNTTKANWDAGRRMRRKNMAETTNNNINSDGSGGDGVDINRNFGTYWGLAYSNNNNASSSTGNVDSYRGPSAFSEPETQRMRDFVNSRQFKIALNYHCYGNWWIRPHGPDESIYPEVALSASHVKTFNSIAALFTKYNCYVYGTAKQTVYAVNGYSDDWLIADPSHSPIYAFSPEIGNAADGFWCPQSKILPYAKEQLFPNLQAAYTAGGFADLQDLSDISIASTTGTFSYTLTRKGLTDAPIIVKLIPLNNIQTVGPADTIASIANFGDTVIRNIAYTLPVSVASGSVVRYVWQLKTGGITINDTITKLYNPTLVFSDNMDISSSFSSNWVRSGTGTAWGYAANAGVNGTASLTESPAGNYANSADHIVRLANALNLSTSTQAYLSFLVKYNSENGLDRLQVEISTTGVTGTYTPISTNNTITENEGLLGGVPALTGSSDGWVREVINLSSYTGNNNVSLRFRFLSNGSNTPAYNTDGFNIDNLKVVKTSASVLPVRFEDITATRVGETIVLKWKAYVDEDFSYYEVQRSANGKDFEVISRINEGNISTYKDVQPLTGHNYYRIKAIEKSGAVRYSKVVLVVFQKGNFITVYPNPVQHMLYVDVTNNKAATVFVEMTTADGRMIYKKKVALANGSNIHKINMAAFADQLYFIKVVSENGVVLQTSKVLKKS